MIRSAIWIGQGVEIRADQADCHIKDSWVRFISIFPRNENQGHEWLGSGQQSKKYSLSFP